VYRVRGRRASSKWTAPAGGARLRAVNRLLAALGPLLGRTLLAALFLYSGWTKLWSPAAAAARIAGRGLPFATAGAIAAGLLEVILGAALVLGLKARPAALGLFAYVAVVTWLFHFAPAQAGDAAQLTQALKNAGLAGGLLLVAAHGPGSVSVDRG
jgi:putative oxidoreductase